MEDSSVSQQKFSDNYSLGEALGKGAFSVVYRAISKRDGKSYAVKVIDKRQIGLDERSRRRTETEIIVLSKVNHPNIIRLHDLADTRNRIYLVMDLVEGGELLDKIISKGFYSEKDAIAVLRKLLDAVKYLHEHNIAHRDLKPENILLQKSDDKHIMVSDFGLSRILGEVSMASTACGTPYYVAPEVLQAKGYNKEVDLWSVGVITYFLLAGYPPFIGETVRDVIELIMKADYGFPSPYWDQVSSSAKDFIQRLLVLEPSQRMTAAEALYHPWLVNEIQDYVPLHFPNVKPNFQYFHQTN